MFYVHGQETLHNHELDNKTSDDDPVEALEAASLETAGMTGNNKRTSLFKNWPLMSSILVYCVLCLHDTAYSEVIMELAINLRLFRLLEFKDPS